VPAHRVDQLEVSRLDGARDEHVTPPSCHDRAVVAPQIGHATHRVVATDVPALPVPNARSAKAAPFVESGA